MITPFCKTQIFQLLKDFIVVDVGGETDCSADLMADLSSRTEAVRTDRPCPTVAVAVLLCVGGGMGGLRQRWRARPGGSWSYFVCGREARASAQELVEVLCCDGATDTPAMQHRAVGWCARPAPGTRPRCATRAGSPTASATTALTPWRNVSLPSA